MLFTIFLLIIGVSGTKKSYDNYQLLRLYPNTDVQVKALRDLELKGEYDFWTRVGRINGSVDVLVPPYKLSEFQRFVQEFEIPHNSKIDDVQRLIEEEKPQVNSICIDMSWDNYHRLEEIYDWIDEKSKKFPFVKKFVAGKSQEGRKIKGMEISFKQNTTGVFIESGIHGSEWITPAATTWMINQILESPEDSVFRNFTYFYIPVFNPDGYSYTWTHDRLWKKTRTPYKNGSVICYGADPNRNWDFNWKKFGESNNACSESYPGPNAFSEPEIQSISNYLKSIARARNIDIYIAYRSYSQILHYPTDHENSSASQREILGRISQAAVNNLQQIHGTQYETGCFSDFYEPAGGMSVEWYYELYKPTLAFTYELRDTGNYGFLLPRDEIIPTGEELLPSLETILNEYLQLNFTDLNMSD